MMIFFIWTAARSRLFVEKASEKMYSKIIWVVAASSLIASS